MRRSLWSKGKGESDWAPMRRFGGVIAGKLENAEEWLGPNCGHWAIFVAEYATVSYKERSGSVSQSINGVVPIKLIVVNVVLV